MSERESTLVEITREAPCAGRREALLRTVAIAGASPADAETSRHLRGCKRCRAFVESLRLGGRLARDVFADLEARAGIGTREPVNLAETKAFDRWLERELETRSERDLAYAMARTAQWLLRCDPEVAERLIDPSEDPAAGAAGAKRATVSHLHQLSQRLSRRWERSDPDIVRSARPNRLDRALETTLAVGPDVGLAASATRLTLAHSLLKQAHELTRGQLGMVWLAKAHVEWFKGDEEKVGGLLERAEGCENTVAVRATVFQHQALLSAENELGGRSIDLLGRALECRASPQNEAMFRGNLAGYFAALGNFDEMIRQVTAIEQSGQIHRLRRRLAPRKIESFIRYIGARHALKTQRVELAYRRCSGVIHGI